MRRYRFIAEHRTRWSVEEMCRVFEVSRSGFYAWRRRPLSRRAQANRRLDMHIQAIFRASQQRYGSPKITTALRHQGIWVNRKRVARRMRLLGLRSRIRRKFRITTDARHAYPVAPNRLARRFRVARPNQVWVSDITYLRTRSGWVYLTVFLDLYSRLVVGWAVSRSLSHEMVIQALTQAVERRRPPAGLLIHSDRGVQYACEAFTKQLTTWRMRQSMSRKGNCWDNAVAESFFRTLKTEWGYHRTLDNRDHAYRELFEYIERFYNRQRLHATLGYQSPMEFERQHSKRCA